MKVSLQMRLTPKGLEKLNLRAPRLLFGPPWPLRRPREGHMHRLEDELLLHALHRQDAFGPEEVHTPPHTALKAMESLSF